MAQAAFDQNRVATLIGVSSADGSTPIKVKVDSVTNRVLLRVNSMGSHSAVTNRAIAYRDQNYVPTAIGESENDDGVLVNLVANTPGYLRVKGA